METTEHGGLLETVDGRTQLAGSNKMEILLFSLGGTEIFGINVFKVREVTWTPKITRTPNMPGGVEGVISLRGNIIPVLDLARFVGVENASSERMSTLMVTEISGRTQGFLVESVDRIIRVDWDKVRAVDPNLTGSQGRVTSVTRLADGRLVSLLDVEQVLADAFGDSAPAQIEPMHNATEASLLFVDDSPVARREISQVLDSLGVRYLQATNGREAWDKLQTIAVQADHEGTPVMRRLKLVLTDAEMPEMDGYVLTRSIKSDRRFNGVPVVMHSSLSSQANNAMGRSVGVDAYVAKFNAGALADTLRPLLSA
jgi:two-component system chemotaxis response regulator CheV